jgi:hypothetical protein
MASGSMAMLMRIAAEPRERRRIAVRGSSAFVARRDPRSAFARLLTHFSPSAVKPRVPPGVSCFLISDFAFCHRCLIFRAMLRPEYLSKKLTPPIPTKDGGTLRTIQDACDYMAAIGKERERRPHWQHVRKLILEEPDVAAVSWQFRLAVLKDAKLDVGKMPA